MSALGSCEEEVGQAREGFSSLDALTGPVLILLSSTFYTSITYEAAFD